MPGKTPFSRLPKTIMPVNYNLWLKPCLKEFTFDGKVDIEVRVEESTKHFELNCADITISSVTYCQKDMTIQECAAVSFSEPQEKVTIEFGNPVAVGEGVLSILFKGELNDKMKGFYRSRYFINGEARYGAVTQFEATDARRCFPCWDEPSLKATFDVTLVVPKNRVALSNMNVISKGDYFEDNELKVVKYARTPIMSTYLLAFVVGEYDYVEGKTKNGLPVCVYTPTGKAKQGQFALDVALKTLPYYEEYFKIPYPLPKMDLIAISDFCAGAMENWGLVTYRETALLIDEENSSAHTRQWVSLVVCHELAHQWFGNLVTMEWWTHLWLNEGFASFMEYLATDFCHPEFDIWTQFVSTDFMRGIQLDALDNSHPIEVPVGHPDEIDEIFDAISYSKGASVIRMLHNWIGDCNFRNGMHDYLTRHAYGNAFTEDLWDALGKASGKPVKDVMDSWTKQMGFPVVSIAIQSTTETSVSLKLTQKKFHANNQVESKLSQIWSIPIAFTTAESPEKPVKNLLMVDQSMEVTLDEVSPNSWIKLNPGTFGFYRVHYSATLLESLLPAVKDQTLPACDRLGLQNDIFALAASGLSSTTDFLQALSAYVNESNYTVWSDLDANIGALSVLMWLDEDIYKKYKTFIVNLYKSTADSLGWDSKAGEGHLDALLRSLVIRRLGRFGCTATIKEAKKRFEDHLCEKECLPADLRSPVYGTVLAHGGVSELNKLLKLHDTVDLHEEKERIERSLGAVSDAEMIKKVLEFAMCDKVRSNDKVFVIGSAAVNSSTGLNTTWDFVKTNWDKLHEMYKGMFLISRLVKLTTENFATEEKAKEVKEFFEENPAAAAERTVQQSIENIQKKIDWWKRDEKSIGEWLHAASSQ